MGSNPAGGTDVCCCECCVLSGSSLCDELISRPEESYRVWFVVVCDLEISWMRRPWPTGGLSRQKKNKFQIITINFWVTVGAGGGNRTFPLTGFLKWQIGIEKTRELKRGIYCAASEGLTCFALNLNTGEGFKQINSIAYLPSSCHSSVLDKFQGILYSTRIPIPHEHDKKPIKSSQTRLESTLVSNLLSAFVTVRSHFLSNCWWCNPGQPKLSNRKNYLRPKHWL